MSPTFSSTGDASKLVTKLGLSRISTMIVTGRPNRPFPSEFQLDVENMFLPGARAAVSVVTNGVATADWNVLEGLVSPDCLTGLVNITSNLEGRELVAIHPDDIFVMFISNVEATEQGNNINLVTFSLPRLGEMKAMNDANKEIVNQMKESIVTMKDQNVDKETFLENVKEFQNKINENDPHNLFKDNEIMLGNFRFVRSSPASDWTITEVGQISSVSAWPSIIRLRWKGRLGLSLKGNTDFYNVLRYDYMKDFMVLLLVWTYWVLRG